MRHVVLHALADGLAPAEVYRRISDFRRYPEYSDTFREVRVEPPLPDGSTVSDWTVEFRGGLMRWRERDTYAPETFSLAFEQLSGDFQSFEGSWRCEPHGGGTLVVFTAAFDLGIPSSPRSSTRSPSRPCGPTSPACCGPGGRGGDR